MFSENSVSVRALTRGGSGPQEGTRPAAEVRGQTAAGVRPRVIAVFGPTGVGKTAVAIALAEALRAQRGDDPVAVSADALQVYAGLPILTGAATADEQARLEHRLLGFVPISETFSAGAFAERAHAEIDALLAQGRRPIVVGGTGLYLRAALAELDLRPPVDPAIRERWASDPRPLAELHALLPPATRAGIDPTDRQRILRALELLEAGHEPPPPRGAPSQLWTEHTRHPTLLAALTMDRKALIERIDARIDAMLAQGVREEVMRADRNHASATARKAVGFRELLAGDVDAMRTKTRQYAKRQLTWLRKLPGAHLIDVTGRAPEDVAAELLAII
jgi:tRNA dimethylallyltransferase